MNEKQQIAVFQNTNNDAGAAYVFPQEGVFASVTINIFTFFFFFFNLDLPAMVYSLLFSIKRIHHLYWSGYMNFISQHPDFFILFFS